MDHKLRAYSLGILLKKIMDYITATSQVLEKKGNLKTIQMFGQFPIFLKISLRASINIQLQ